MTITVKLRNAIRPETCVLGDREWRNGNDLPLRLFNLHSNKNVQSVTVQMQLPLPIQLKWCFTNNYRKDLYYLGSTNHWRS